MSGSERVQVKTRVPEWQKTEWKAHADELGMSQSEFVRSMVQAGRRELGLEGSQSDSEEGGDSGPNPGGDGFEERVEAVLEERGVLSWEELVGAVTDDVEQEVEEALDELQAANRVRYSGREGGYVLVDEQ